MRNMLFQFEYTTSVIDLTRRYVENAHLKHTVTVNGNDLNDATFSNKLSGPTPINHFAILEEKMKCNWFREKTIFSE